MSIEAMKQALEQLNLVMKSGPAVKKAKEILQQAIEEEEEYEDQTDYVGMGWVDSRGRP